LKNLSIKSRERRRIMFPGECMLEDPDRIEMEKEHTERKVTINWGAK